MWTLLLGPAYCNQWLDSHLTLALEVSLPETAEPPRPLSHLQKLHTTFDSFNTIPLYKQDFVTMDTSLIKLKGNMLLQKNKLEIPLKNCRYFIINRKFIPLRMSLKLIGNAKYMMCLENPVQYHH